MTGPDEPRPWWASDPQEPVGEDPAGDPLTAHRRARAGVNGTDAADVPAWWAPAAEAVARLSEDLAGTSTSNAAEARGHRPWHDTVPGRAPGDHGPDDGLDDGPGTDGLDDDGLDDDGLDGPGTVGDADPGGRRAPTGGDPAVGEERPHLDVCGVCPVCVGIRALGTQHPELVGHLAEAGRHLAAAVRGFVDAAAAAGAGRPTGAGGWDAADDHAPERAPAGDGLHAISLEDLDDLEPLEDLDGRDGPAGSDAVEEGEAPGAVDGRTGAEDHGPRG